MEFGLLLKFSITLIVVTIIIAVIIRQTMFASTESAVTRLNEEIKKTNMKQAELSKKIKDADDELAKRQAEAKELNAKMLSEAEEASKAEREKIVNDARAEGEEIIAKAQESLKKMKFDLEKDLDMRAITFGFELLNDVLSEKAKGVLNQTLAEQFLDGLKNMDMSQINRDVNTADIVTLSELDDAIKANLKSIISEKLGRDIAINVEIDETIGGGIIVKFGSMALDGSLKNALREKATEVQEVVDEKTLKNQEASA